MWTGQRKRFQSHSSSWMKKQKLFNELYWIWYFSAQQAFETLKLTFGDNKCFLVQINSEQTPSTNDETDPWLKFLRRQPKMVYWIGVDFSNKFVDWFFIFGCYEGWHLRCGQCTENATRRNQPFINATDCSTVNAGNSAIWCGHRGNGWSSS